MPRSIEARHAHYGTDAYRIKHAKEERDRRLKLRGGRPATNAKLPEAERKRRKKLRDAKPENQKRRQTHLPKWKFKRRVKEAGYSPPQTCELCRRERPLVWDHDHETGRFRGWICGGCNTSLGKLGDSIEGLQHAIRYLKRELPWQNP